MKAGWPLHIEFSLKCYDANPFVDTIPLQKYKQSIMYAHVMYN